MLRKDLFLRKSKIFYVGCVLILIASCGLRSHKKNEFTINAPTAPDITSTYGWLNTDKTYTLKDFRGKIVLLDFWTLGCINCQHIIPEVKKLQEKFSKEPG